MKIEINNKSISQWNSNIEEQWREFSRVSWIYINYLHFFLFSYIRVYYKTAIKASLRMNRHNLIIQQFELRLKYNTTKS